MSKRAIYIIGLIIFTILSYLFTPVDEVHFFWEKLPIFNIIFGFIGCIIIIFVSKFLGHLFIQKKEDYYD
jgi:uncharacterized membrane protein YeaQ/YmgE (transglycosylase-associated protein family)